MTAFDTKRYLPLVLSLFGLAFLLSTGSYLFPYPTGAENYEIVLAPKDLQKTARLESFEQIYETNEWGSDESVSGKGSTMIYTERARTLIGYAINKYGLQSMTDGPCGDCNWQPSSPHFQRLAYTGLDIVPALILANSRKYRHMQNMRFINLDLALDALPAADVFMCRDVIQHLSLEDGMAVIRNIEASGSRYLLTNFHVNKGTHRADENRDIPSGRFYPNHIMKAPFNFPPPLAYILDMHDGYFDREGDEMGIKLIGLWKLPALGMGDGSSFPVDFERSKNLVVL